jgi:hypothetical protein
MTSIPVTKTVTPVLDAGAYATGEVLFNPIIIPGVLNKFGDRCTLQSVYVLDKAAQGIAFDLVFLDALVNLGTLNGNADISDVNAAAIIGVLPIVAGDFLAALTGGLSRQGQKNNIAMQLDAASGSRDFYVGAITRGTPTYGAADALTFKFGFLLRP